MNPFARSRPAPRARALTRAWDLADPASRRRAWLHYHLKDHAILRHLWTNFGEVAPGVWRSNHPTHDRLAAYRDRGVRTILNLRGTEPDARYLFERESCEALGLRLVSVALSARRPPARAQVLALFEAFRAVDRPFLIHCKSGADRTSFASALYLLAQGAPLAEARRQMSWRFLHFRSTRAGILDHVLGLYEAARETSGIGVEAWFRDAYDPDAAQAGFRA